MSDNSLPMTDVKKLLAYQATRYQEYTTQIADELAAKHVADNKAMEDERAEHRNRNRALTLPVAIIMGLLVVTVMPAIGLAALMPYSFVITILPDAAITAYAWAKKF